MRFSVRAFTFEISSVNCLITPVTAIKSQKYEDDEKFARFCFSVMPVPVFCEQLQAADLIQIYREALEEDAQYGSARAAYIAAQERLPQGRAGLLPDLRVTGTAQNQYIDTSGAPTREIKNRGFTVALTQPIIRFENFIIYQQSKTKWLRLMHNLSLLLRI